MGKYEPLAARLSNERENTWVASFGEIEAVLGFSLPPSAHTHREWWGNQRGGGHSQAKGWQEAGWQVWKVDLPAKRVEFRRAGFAGESSGARQDYARPDNLDDLVRQASEITGIADRELLIREALRRLIAREAGLRLARMGGTMPDIKVPPRERPSL
jgi:hypothetical protein